MIVEINYWAVLVAAVASMVIGFLWYGPIFGKLWIRLSGFTAEQISAGKTKSMGGTYMISFFGSLAMSYVLAHALIFASEYLQIFGLTAGLTAAFWNWFGFVMPVTLSNVLWEGKSWKLWVLGNGYY